jgi:hypothetical protein
MQVYIVCSSLNNDSTPITMSLAVICRFSQIIMYEIMLCFCDILCKLLVASLILSGAHNLLVRKNALFFLFLRVLFSIGDVMGKRGDVDMSCQST